MILKQVQVFHIRCVTLSVAFNHPFCFHVLLDMWTLERAEHSLISQNTYDVSVILVLSKHEVILCGTNRGTLSVWSIRSLLEGLSEKRNCSRMLSNCSEGMKNCDNGSAYLQTLDTCFLKICSITELTDEVQRLKLRNNQVTELSARLQIDFE
jgi:hypothetical protein